MSELLPMLRQLVADVDAGHAVAICSVVHTRGSTPQSPGAAMLVRSNMSTVGTLGGGCVEAQVRKDAFAQLQRQESALLEFVLDHDYGWDDGLICGGNMQIAMQPVHAVNVAPFRAALARAEQRQPASFPLRVSTDEQPVEFRVHLEVPPRLLIAGAGHVGCAVARLAVDLDFHVIVIDDRADLASPQRFDPRVDLQVGSIAETLACCPLDESCYVVIVTRGHRHDHQALAAVIRRPAGYIGLIGSKRKAVMILRDLAEQGVPEDVLQRVHTPIGLKIGAITVPEIAVSIAAQLVEHRRRQAPRLVEGPFPVSAANAT